MTLTFVTAYSFAMAALIFFILCLEIMRPSYIKGDTAGRNRWRVGVFAMVALLSMLIGAGFLSIYNPKFLLQMSCYAVVNGVECLEKVQKKFP